MRELARARARVRVVVGGCARSTTHRLSGCGLSQLRLSWHGSLKSVWLSMTGSTRAARSTEVSSGAAVFFCCLMTVFPNTSASCMLCPVHLSAHVCVSPRSRPGTHLLPRRPA